MAKIQGKLFQHTMWKLISFSSSKLNTLYGLHSEADEEPLNQICQMLNIWYIKEIKNNYSGIIFKLSRSLNDLNRDRLLTMK